MIWVIFIKNIEEYNLGKTRERLILFDNMIGDIVGNKKNLIQ